MSYEILEHPADAKFRAVGDSLDEAFSEATEALGEITGDAAAAYTHEVEIESENLGTLLFDYLERLIFLQDTERIVVAEASEMDVQEEEDGWRLEAEIKADSIDSETTAMDLKAPTYSGMKATYQEGEGWVLEAVIDI
jgi:SHS2 domain-containing protein